MSVKLVVRLLIYKTILSKHPHLNGHSSHVASDERVEQSMAILFNQGVPRTLNIQHKICVLKKISDL